MIDDKYPVQVFSTMRFSVDKAEVRDEAERNLGAVQCCCASAERRQFVVALPKLHIPKVNLKHHLRGCASLCASSHASAVLSLLKNSFRHIFISLFSPFEMT